VVDRLTSGTAETEPAGDGGDLLPVVPPEAVGEVAGEGAPEQAGAKVVPVPLPSELFVPVARLEIPKVGVAVDIRAGVTAAQLELGVGLWEGLPENRYVLSGHRTTYGAPFRHLDRLVPGDQVLLTLGAGTPEVFQVLGTKIVPESDYVREVLEGTPGEPGDRIITMYACDPPGDRTHRIVVRAKAVGASA
jgi:sortase A